MSFSKDDALLAIDSALSQLMTLRRIVEEAADEQPDLDPWLLACPDNPRGGPHEVMWDREGATGMCRACGATFDRHTGA